jgi:hypothetical protein
MMGSPQRTIAMGSSVYLRGVDPVLWSPSRYGWRIPGMQRFKPPYPAEFRARIVELIRSGRTIVSLTKEFSVSDIPFATGCARRISMPGAAAMG